MPDNGNGNSNLRVLYKVTKTLAGKKSFRKMPLESKNGPLIVTSVGQLQYCREHFATV